MTNFDNFVMPNVPHGVKLKIESVEHGYMATLGYTENLYYGRKYADINLT